jgi:general secretion pathway protein E
MLTAERIADVLVQTGRLGAAEAASLRREARGVARPRGRAAHQRSTAYELVEQMQFRDCSSDEPRPLTEVEIAQAIAEAARLPYVRVDPLQLNADLIESKISRPFALRHRMLPLHMDSGKLKVALADPWDLEGIDSFRRLVAGHNVEFVVASEPDILRALTEFYGLRQSVKRAEQDLSAGIDLGNLEALVHLKSDSEIESSDQHIVKAVEFMLQHAYDTRASDIHIEPKRDASLIRFRIDGVLHDIQHMPKVVHRAVVSRLKTMARLDIAERRRPQDGRIKTARREREVELRVSTLPVAFGEKVVLRIFDPESFLQDLSSLGMDDEELATFQEFIARPHGIILVTGPTGSGKSTTLYSALETIADSTKNVSTIEDPIEMVHETFNQTAVLPKAGVTFASALRHILRQDPDVIMVGEIRDPETAHYATQAAMTGHLVFSTLHTNDAPSAITRLTDLGVERFLIASTMIGAVAQRLLRKICAHCADEHYLSEDETRALGLAVPEGKRLRVRQGRGCAECRGTGYYGRTGVFEILPIDDQVKQLVQGGADAPTIKREAARRGMKTIRQSALQKLARGITTVEEVIRVTAL